MSNDLERQMDAVFQDAMLHGIGVARVHLDDFVATDRIEQLERARDEYFGISVHWRKEADVLAEQRREAEAKLAKAVEALRSVDAEYTDIQWGPELQSIKQVRAVLAALECEPLGAEFEAVWDANKEELYQS